MQQAGAPVKWPPVIAVPWQPLDDWTQLEGMLVEIYRAGSLRDWGQVESVTADGSILWLAMNGPSPRRIVENHTDVQIRAVGDVQVAR